LRRGAVVGFIVKLLILELVGFGNRADTIMSRILALLVFAPLGALACVVLSTMLARRLRGGESTGGVLRNGLVMTAKCAIAPSGPDGTDPHARPTLLPGSRPEVCSASVEPRCGPGDSSLRGSHPAWNPRTVACRAQSVWYVGALERLFAARCH